MQNLQAITDDYPIGMNDRYPSHLLGAGMYALLQNVVVDQNKFVKRKGTNPIAASLGAHTILGLSAFNPVAGTNSLIALLDGSSNAQLYSWGGSGAFAAIGTANITKGIQMNFAQASNLLYGFNGKEAVSWDGTTYTHNPTSVPLGTYAVWFHNYLFVANTAANPSRVFWSNLGDPTTFAGTNFVDINPNDGDQITGLAVFNDTLFVFKNNTIWSITGFSGTSFSATTIAGQNTNNKIYGYGCPSQKSIVVTGKDMYYLSFLGGIPHFRSFVQTQYATTLEQGIVSYDIEGTLTTLNQSQLALVAGAFDGKYVYWGVPTGAHAYNDTVLAFYPTIKVKGGVMMHRSWTKFIGFTPAQFATSNISGQQIIYFGDGQTSGNVSQMNYATFADNGTAVVMTVQSRDIQFDKARKAKFKYIYLFYKTGSAGTLNISARIDDTVNYSLQYVLPLAGNSPGLGSSFILGTSVLGGATTAPVRATFTQMIGHHLSFQLQESTANSCEVDNIVIYGKAKPLRAS